MGFDNEILFGDGMDSVLIVEDKKLFTHIIFAINQMVNGKEIDEIIFLKDDTKVNSKYINLIIDPFHIELNSKKILSILYKNIELEYLEDNDAFKHHVIEMNNELHEVISDYNLEFSYIDDITIVNYLKMINFKIDTSQHTQLIDIIIDYIEIVSELLSNEIIIFCNVLSYLTDKEIKEVCKYKNYKHINVLFIENVYNCQYNMNEYFIDNDLCEYFR